MCRFCTLALVLVWPAARAGSQAEPPGARADPARIAAHYEQSQRLRETDRARAISSAEEGLALAERLADRPWTAKLKMQLGHLWSADGKRNTSLAHYLEALRVYEELGDQDGEADALNAVAVDYYFIGFYHLALEYQLRALEHRERQADPYLLAQALNNLGLVYVGIEGYEEAVEFFSRSLALKRGVSDPIGISRTLTNLGYAHYHLGNHDQALEHQREAIELREAVGDDDGIAYPLSVTGHVRRELGQHRAALDAYARSLARYRRLGDPHGVAEVLRHRGELQLSMGRLEEARASLEEAIRIGREIGDQDHVSSANAVLAGVWEEQGEFARALRALQESVSIERGLLSEQSYGQITEMRTRYDEERRQRELDLLRRDNAIGAMELRQQQLQRVGLTAGLSLALVVAGLTLVLYRQSRSSNRALTAKTEEVERAYAELQTANAALQVARERAELMARQDALTGLANRRGFLDALEREKARATRTGRAFSLLLGDLDLFKRINDGHGHEAGDSVLKEVAARFRARLREQDTCARWGGEEFIFLLAETDLDGATALAEELRRDVAQRPFGHQGQSIPITMTFGVASDAGAGLEELLDHADRALLDGKKRGRNCVVPWSPPKA